MEESSEAAIYQSCVDNCRVEPRSERMDFASFFHRKQILLSAISVLCLFVLLFLLPVPRAITEATADVGASPTPTISISPADAILLKPTTGGATVSDSATISVTTSNYTGYDLFLTSTSAGKDMNLIASDPTDPQYSNPASITTLAEDTAASSSTFTGHWGYSLDNTTFKAIPETSGDMIATSQTSTPAGDDTTVYIGTRAGASQEPGVYIGSLALTAVAHPNMVYTVNYEPGTTDPVTNLPEDISGTTTNATISISSQSPARTDYTFLGWATTEGGSVVYAPGAAITLDPTTNNVFNLYATWKTTPVMQDIANWVSELDINQSVQAKDSRDGKIYWVTKLLDGNVWMTQNLDLDLSTSIALTSADSDVTSSWTPTVSTYTSTGTWTTITYSKPQSYDPGDTQYLVTSGSTSNDTIYNSLSACTAAGNTEEVCQHGHSGNYYNWNAATAGSDASTMDDGDEAPQSICPKGWRLPYGTQANKSWYYMLSTSIPGYASDAATSQAMRTAPFYIPRAGYYNSLVYYVGSGGNYWSSTAHGDLNGGYGAYALYLYSTSVAPQNNDFATSGNSVRCVAINATLTYDANEGSGAPASVTQFGANPITISATIPTRAGYNFLGWDTNSAAASATYAYDSATQTFTPSTIAIRSDTTLYAVWALDTKTVTASSNNSAYGSVSPTSASVATGSAISASGPTMTIGSTTITATANSGYMFDNWTNNCGSTLTADCSVVANFSVNTTTFDQAFAAAGKSKVGGYYKMQDMTASICSTVTTPTTTTEAQTAQLIDSRDSKVYWVAKLKDNHCWMTQNLDLFISTSGTALTTADSNVTANKTLTATNVWTSYTDISFYEGGNNYLPNGTDSATSTTGLAADSTNWHYHVGNYYNWPAATAGSGTSSVTDADATESICPKGWRLPTSNSYTNNYSFGKLTNAYGITSSATGSSDAALLSSPLWFVRAGDVDFGDLRRQGSGDIVWSSRAGSGSDYAYSLLFYSSYVDPSSNSYRNSGFSVRCVAE